MISVIIPLYNKEQTILSSIESVLSQSFQDIELIVVDDGSTDSSVSVVESIGDSRLTLIKQENAGPSAARNTGLHSAHGEWIVFLDADDELCEDALTVMHNKCALYPDADIIDFNKYIRKDGKLTLQKHPIEGHGWYEVHDTCNKRYTNLVDILIHPTHKGFCKKGVKISNKA